MRTSCWDFYKAYLSAGNSYGCWAECTFCVKPSWANWEESANSPKTAVNGSLYGGTAIAVPYPHQGDNDREVVLFCILSRGDIHPACQNIQIVGIIFLQQRRGIQAVGAAGGALAAF